ILTRTEVYAPDARIVAIGTSGEVAVPRSTWVFFQGRDVDGSARTAVSLDPATGTMRGLVSSERGLHELLPPAVWTGGRHRLAAPETGDADGTPRTWKCAEEDLPLAPSGPSPGGLSGRENLAGREALAVYSKYAVVAIDTDNEFMNLKFSDNTTNAANYIANLYNQMNLIYERDLQLHLLQGYTILRLSTVADPYVQNSGSNANGSELSEFASYWGAHYGGVKRMLAAFLSGKQPTTNAASGIAYVGTLCNTGFGYSFSKILRNPGDSSSFDVLIVAHELGHNFGSPHTHCYSPPADACFSTPTPTSCYNGVTSCPAPVVINGFTATGTLMSYCHLSCSGSTLAFHPRSLTEYMNGNISLASSCIFNGAVAPTGPAVSGIVPATGSTLGGTSVTINGSGFVSGATLAFIESTGSLSLTSVTFVNAGQLTAVTPAHAAGAMDVVVFNPDNVTGTRPNGFTYTTVGTPPPPPPVSAATGFNAVTPCRLLDTRNAAGPLGGPSIGALGLRSFVVTGVCGVPAGAVAVSANVTAVNPAAAGDLVVYPNGIASPPTASAISLRAGRTRANNTLVYLASDGAFLVKNNATGALDLLVDVNGYFK
ncbi:MAG: M12 family metallo-peptidase, partial [Acidobacteriota bacterium]